MRICVLGAGAVGGHIAARLGSSDAEVPVIARGATLDAIRDRGLRVELLGDSIVTHPKATNRVEDLPPQDIVIVTVKAPSLPPLATDIRTLLADDGLALFVLNGIPWWYPYSGDASAPGSSFRRLDPRGALQKRVGVERTLGGVAYTAGTVVAPGVIHAKNPRNRLHLGRPDGREDPRVSRLAAALTAGGLEVTETTSIRDAIWAKLTLNLVGGTLAVLSGSPMKHTLSQPGVPQLAAQMAEEAANIARALGCEPGDIAAGLETLSRSGHLQSIAQDLHAGRPMEIDSMLRVPIELASTLGIATPHLGPLVRLAIERARVAGCYESGL